MNCTQPEREVGDDVEVLLSDWDTGVIETVCGAPGPQREYMVRTSWGAKRCVAHASLVHEFSDGAPVVDDEGKRWTVRKGLGSNLVPRSALNFVHRDLVTKLMTEEEIVKFQDRHFRVTGIDADGMYTIKLKEPRNEFEAAQWEFGRIEHSKLQDCLFENGEHVWHDNVQKTVTGRVEETTQTRVCELEDESGEVLVVTGQENILKIADAGEAGKGGEGSNKGPL